MNAVSPIHPDDDYSPAGILEREARRARADANSARRNIKIADATAKAQDERADELEAAARLIRASA